MRLPILQPGNTSRIVTDVFRGYNHNMKIADGEMFDMANLTSDYYPMLAMRKKHTMRCEIDRPYGLLGGDELIWVSNRVLYVDGVATPLTFDADYDPRQLVRFGHYVVAFPDGKYYNLNDPTDYGDMTAAIDHPSQYGPDDRLTYEPCDIDGNLYIANYEQATEPATAADGEIWFKTDTIEIYKYSSIMTQWVKVENVYTKINFPSHGEIPASFKAGDGVEISGLAFDQLNGTKFLYKVGGDAQAYDYIIVVGVGGVWSQIPFDFYLIKREVPNMNFVVECQNRLWGCYYSPGGDINEVYCSALGDFKNWRVYQGLSTDSWAASVGAPGPWTGAVSYLGKPIFFKEDRMFVVTISPQGAHRMEETPCRGVGSGCERSLCVVGEYLLYKSSGDVMAWQGGFPASISDQIFGDITYERAIGGSVGTKYYLSMKRTGEVNYDFFVYDTQRGFWIKEGGAPYRHMVTVGRNLWALTTSAVRYDPDTGTPIPYGELWEISGQDTGYPAEEGQIHWFMESGILYYEYPDHKYVSRFNIRIWMDADSTAKIYLEYDSSGTWVDMGTVKIAGTGTVTVPICPRRCDHMRMRLSGTGDFKLFSVARILEVGSDV